MQKIVDFDGTIIDRNNFQFTPFDMGVFGNNEFTVLFVVTY